MQVKATFTVWDMWLRCYYSNGPHLTDERTEVQSVAESGFESSPFETLFLYLKCMGMCDVMKRTVNWS